MDTTDRRRIVFPTSTIVAQTIKWWCVIDDPFTAIIDIPTAPHCGTRKAERYCKRRSNADCYEAKDHTACPNKRVLEHLRNRILLLIMKPGRINEAYRVVSRVRICM